MDPDAPSLALLLDPSQAEVRHAAVLAFSSWPDVRRLGRGVEDEGQIYSGGSEFLHLKQKRLSSTLLIRRWAQLLARTPCARPGGPARPGTRRKGAGAAA